MSKGPKAGRIVQDTAAMREQRDLAATMCAEGAALLRIPGGDPDPVVLRSIERAVADYRKARERIEA